MFMLYLHMLEPFHLFPFRDSKVGILSETFFVMLDVVPTGALSDSQHEQLQICLSHSSPIVKEMALHQASGICPITKMMQNHFA